MSMSDARQFAELTARVDTLEELCRSLAASVDALEGRVFGIDVHNEVLGPVADEGARDGLRAMLKERRAGTAPEVDSPGLLEAAGGDPKPEDKPKGVGEADDLAADPGLKDRLAALQGGEAGQAAPSKPSMRK